MCILFITAIAIHDKDPPGCLRKYEAYNSCGTACPLTCKNKEPKSCTRECVPGCYCQKGYVRNEADGSCCTPDECPGNFCLMLGKTCRWLVPFASTIIF